MPDSQFKQIMHSMSELFAEVQALREDFKHLRCKIPKADLCDSEPPTTLIEVEHHV